MRTRQKTDNNGDLLIAGKIFNYSKVLLSINKISFLFEKPIFKDVENEIKRLDGNIFWSSKISPNDSTISDCNVWWKIDGQYNYQLHENILNMDSFSEITIYLVTGSFQQLDKIDMRDFKLDMILEGEESDSNCLRCFV